MAASDGWCRRMEETEMLTKSLVGKKRYIKERENEQDGPEEKPKRGKVRGGKKGRRPEEETRKGMEDQEDGLPETGDEELLSGRQRWHERTGELTGLFLTAYLFVLFIVFPLFMQNGYRGFGDMKFYFFRDVTVGALCLLVPLAVVFVCTGGADGEAFWKGWRFPGCVRGWSAVDWCMGLYLLSVLISFVLSKNKAEALWGTEGWHMGLLTQLIFIALYFLLSRLWEYSDKAVGMFLAGSVPVFLLAVLNRFSVYPIPLEATAPGFLSTMGNINWLCGYWAIAFAMGTVLYWVTDRRWVRRAGAAYVFLGCMTGVVQGSSSAFLVFAGLFLLLFFFSASSVRRLKRFLEIVMLFCLASQSARLIRAAAPGAYNYYEGNMCDFVTSSDFTLVLLAGTMIVYLVLFLIRDKVRRSPSGYRILRQSVIVAAVFAVGIYLMLVLLNTVWGIGPLAGSTAFTLDERWGSSRAGTWKDGLMAFGAMPVINKLFGVGPDCFASFAYSVPEIAENIREQFGDARLTNAHNEWLTMLVNGGILGLVSYAGLFVSAMAGYWKKGRAKPWFCLFAAAAFCYTLHNMVSFQQILSTPFIFALLGVAESCRLSAGEAEASETLEAGSK